MRNTEHNGLDFVAQVFALAVLFAIMTAWAKAFA